MALVALMQARAGRGALAAHLPLLAAVAVKALDPAHPARRRALVQVRRAVGRTSSLTVARRPQKPLQGVVCPACQAHCVLARSHQRTT